MKNKAFNPFTNKSAFTLSLFIGTILNAIMFLGYIYNINESVDKLRFIYTFPTNILVLYLLYIFSFNAIQKKWKKTARFWFTIIGTVVIAIPLSLILSECFALLMPDNSIFLDKLFIANLIKDLIFVIIVLLSTFLLYTTSERQKTLLENEKLIADNIRIRYEVLKNQVDPHFLFNSLNTLDGLIGMDTDKAHEYVQHLSVVFRYAIGNKEIMQLDDELNFTESYAHLMKIRYGDNFKIQYNIANDYRTWYIMPISLQLLVENAIKHNIISTKYPLTVKIETTANDTIRVSNTIQAKNKAESGSGIGLSNLTERYRLLFQKEISITITDTFCVEIPLIKELENSKKKQHESSNNRRRECCIPKFTTINKPTQH
jgi:two-component system, LytTR family, sensor kinase